MNFTRINENCQNQRLQVIKVYVQNHEKPESTKAEKLIWCVAQLFKQVHQAQVLLLQSARL